MQQLQAPHLAKGEVYIGAIGDKNGDFYHVILLPGDSDDATWQEQIDWAKSVGGDLPTRVEQSMMWADYREQFKKDWYWSNEKYERSPSFAWYQCFGYGNQTRFGIFSQCRARAVRRLPI